MSAYQCTHCGHSYAAHDIETGITSACSVCDCLDLNWDHGIYPEEIL